MKRSEANDTHHRHQACDYEQRDKARHREDGRTHDGTEPDSRIEERYVDRRGGERVSSCFFDGPGLEADENNRNRSTPCKEEETGERWQCRCDWESKARK